ncbi:MAG: hypothetical protein GY749_38060 [Desulfobacteraceae bacterium]|nr:hypothetical protein [Desulfobacteraceae bacterium]
MSEKRSAKDKRSDLLPQIRKIAALVFRTLDDKHIMKSRFESYFTKALYDTKNEEILRMYRNKKFSARKNVKTNGVEFDAVVQKNEILEHEILPFNGELFLNLRDNKIEHAELKIDTIYWYE